MKKYRIAIAGAGRATEEITLQAFTLGKSFADLRGGHIVAVADPNTARQELMKNRYGIPNTYNSVNEMMDAGLADLLIVNSPVQFHHEHAITAIEKGIPFILEKPATSTADQLKNIRDLAEEHGVKGTVVHNYKFKDGFRKAIKWYENGSLGNIINAERVWMSPPGNDRMEMNREGWWHKIPGGRLADSLPHHLYMLYPFVGEMSLEYVSVKKLALDRPWSKCDEAMIVLSTGRGYVSIVMSTNQDSWPEGKGSGPYDLILYGTKQSAAVFQDDAHLFRNRSFKFKMRTCLETLGTDIPTKIKGMFGIRQMSGIRGGHNVLYAEFMRYLDGERDNPTSWDEAVHVMELTEEISEEMEAQIRQCGNSNSA